MMIGSGADRKFVLQISSLKNGGFKKYQSLPPQEILQHTYSVLDAILEVKIKQRQIFFTRKTGWMFLPVYLLVNKGLLLVYNTKNSGYALRISAAKKLNFKAIKNKKLVGKKKKNPQKYSAQISLQYQFGEIEMKFENAETCRYWRYLLLTAHESLKDVAMAGHEVSKGLSKFSSSLESVVSAQSVYPEEDDKDNSERVAVHRHSLLNSSARPQAQQPELNNYLSQSSSSSESPVVASPKMIQEPPLHIQSASSSYDNNNRYGIIEEEETFIAQTNVKEADSFASLWDEIEEEYKTQTTIFVGSNSFEQQHSSPIVGTSEVDVTLRDVDEPPLSPRALKKSVASLIEEIENGTVNSHTTACKTSSSQITRQSSIASIASRRSAFLEDFRRIDVIPEEEDIIVVEEEPDDANSTVEDQQQQQDVSIITKVPVTENLINAEEDDNEEVVKEEEDYQHLVPSPQEEDLQNVASTSNNRPISNVSTATTMTTTMTTTRPPQSPSSWSYDDRIKPCDSTTFLDRVDECVHDLSRMISEMNGKERKN